MSAQEKDLKPQDLETALVQIDRLRKEIGILKNELQDQEWASRKTNEGIKPSNRFRSLDVCRDDPSHRVHDDIGRMH